MRCIMLALEEVIIESHDDFEIWSSVVVGFDTSKNLVVRLDCIDYKENGSGVRQDAVVGKEDAFALSCRWHTKLTGLPHFIYSRFGDGSNLSVPSEVEGLFKEILDFILDSGGRYVLDRQRLRD